MVSLLFPAPATGGGSGSVFQTNAFHALITVGESFHKFGLPVFTAGNQDHDCHQDGCYDIFHR